MKLSTTVNELADSMGAEQAMIKLSEIGFDAVDLMFRDQRHDRIREDYMEYAQKLHKVTKQYPITVGQTHAPFPSYIDGDPEETEFMFEQIVKAIQATACVGAEYIVIHPPIMKERRYGEKKEENKAISMDFYHRLRPYAERYGVKIAVENMWNFDSMRKRICPCTCSTAEEMVDYIDTLGNDLFVACLDAGHALLTYDSPARMAKVLGSRLKVLHVHDVDGIDDLHTVPYLGNNDWPEFCQALKEIGYKGTFNFETNNYISRFPSELAVPACEFLYKIGRHLCSLYK